MQKSSSDTIVTNEISAKEQANISMDRLQEKMQQREQVNCELEHEFTPGLYVRTIFMPAGTLIISKIHKTEHPFNLSQGIVRVKVNDGKWEILEAPYRGITKPETRRVLYIEADAIWTTYHPTDISPYEDSEEGILNAVERVEDVIIEKRELNVPRGTLLTNKP